MSARFIRDSAGVLTLFVAFAPEFGVKTMLFRVPAACILMVMCSWLGVKAEQAEHENEENNSKQKRSRHPSD